MEGSLYNLGIKHSEVSNKTESLLRLINKQSYDLSSQSNAIEDFNQKINSLYSSNSQYVNEGLENLRKFGWLNDKFNNFENRLEDKFKETENHIPKKIRTFFTLGMALQVLVNLILTLLLLKLIL